MLILSALPLSKQKVFLFSRSSPLDGHATPQAPANLADVICVTKVGSSQGSSMKFSKVALLSVLAMAPIASQAGWETIVRDDVLSDSKTALMLGEVDGNHSLVFDCDSDGLELSLLEGGEWQQHLSAVPAKLVIKVDQQEKHNFEASFYQRNEKNIGIKAEGGDLNKLLSELKTAKSKVLIGMVIPAADSKWTGEASAVGSTGAVGKFADACNIKL